MGMVIDPVSGVPVFLGVDAGSSQYSFSGADSDPVPRGLETIIKYRDLLLNDRSAPERIRILGIDGTADPDVRIASQENPSRHGETALMSYYGGRTLSFEGHVVAGNLNKLRQMQQQLREAFLTLEE